MSLYLLSVGDAAGRALPVIFAALSSGAACSVPGLRVFALSRGQDNPEKAASLASSLSGAHRRMAPAEGAPFFPAEFSFESCIPVFRDLRNNPADPSESLLFDALRGKGLPFSAFSDGEAAEWSFADLLSRPEDPSVAPLLTWLRKAADEACTAQAAAKAAGISEAHADPASVADARAANAAGAAGDEGEDEAAGAAEAEGEGENEAAAESPEPAVRLAVLADCFDPFAGGAARALLPFLRTFFEQAGAPVCLSFIALGEAAPPQDDSFSSFVSDGLKRLGGRSGRPLWMLSLPSSMVASPEAFRVTALAAGRVLAEFASGRPSSSSRVGIREIDGTLSAGSLGDQAPAFAAFVRGAVWLLTDLFPAFRSYLAHPARFRSLTVNPRSALFRQLLAAAESGPEPAEDLNVFESVLRSVLTEVLAFAQSVPAALRSSGSNVSLWQQAVSACGRYITVAAEYDVSAAEARESGLDSVRPVHRVSMADTEEEQLVRRLQDMHRQLDQESAALEKICLSLGGYKALQVRMDCRLRCESALKAARAQAAAPADGLDHLSLMKRARRVRLLEAAVERCGEDIAAASAVSALSRVPSAGPEPADPYAFTVLTPEGCRALEQLLSASGGESLPKMPPLFPSLPDPDPKVRIRALASFCSEALSSPAARRPVPFLVERVLSLCLQELSGVSFPRDRVMPAVPLLPDLFVGGAFLSEEEKRIREGGGSLGAKAVTEEQKGLLAMLLLRQYRRCTAAEAALACTELRPESSPVLQYWLSARGADKAYVFSLGRDDLSLPVAVAIPGHALLPARRIQLHKDLIPDFCTWYDREKDVFLNPVPFLAEGDRMLLQTQLGAMRKAFGAAAEHSDPADPDPLGLLIRAMLDDLSPEEDPPAPDPQAAQALRTRLQAVCGLQHLPAYAASLTKETCFYERFLPSDLVAACLLGVDSFPASSCEGIPEDAVYSFRGVPFARGDSRLLLVSAHAPGEEYTLSRLSAECEVLSAASDDFRDALLLRLRELLERCPDALPGAKKTASSLLKEVAEPLDRREPVFTWPWDEQSPSILTVLQESLGASVSLDALHPFSDCLTVFPARGLDVIGDSLLSSMCTVLPLTEAPEGAEIAPDAVLPPLSPAFANVLCLLPEGRTLLKPGLLAFERFREEPSGFAKDVSDSFRVTLTLDGAFPVHLVRAYAPEEVRHLYAHDIPTVALWPSVPFRRQDWHAYYVYAHLSAAWTVSVLSADAAWAEVTPTSEDRCAAVFEAFPVCLSLRCGEQTAGLLPNVLPEPLVEPAGPVTVCVDFGSSGTSVVFAGSAGRRPMHGPVMVRTLLNNPASSRELLRREFLPAVPVSALLPTVSRLFRNVPGAAPVPFADGIVLMSSSLEDLLSTPSDAIYTSLRWEEEKGRSGFLCLHQVMLMAALQARYEGADRLSWRFSLPDEMAREGRESLMNLFASLAENVFRESGYSSDPGDPAVLPVAFASDSSALGAYFRFCAAEDTRGGFMVLDLGACTADISLFLRGREQAVRTCQIPLGIHYMLLPSLLRDPDLLARDFSFCQDPAFLRDLSLLSKALSAARTDPVALRRARVALDFFVADHLPLMVSLALQLAAGGYPTRSGALILLHLAFLLMLSGLVLLQLAADPARNDFLPEQMSLCLSGRGIAILESFPPPLKKSLWHFLSMFRNKRVASLSFLFSAEKKMEIPVGLSLLQEVYSDLPPASAVPASVAVRPAELLPEFLLRFRKAFPASAELLFPGCFTNDYYHPFTGRGEALFSSSIDHTFPPAGPDLKNAENPRPYDNLAAWLGNLLDMMAQ